MKYVASIAGFTLLFLVPTNLIATHIVGGEINYRCLGNNDYEITLQIFRDCFFGEPWFDEPASIGIFGDNDSLLFDLRPFPMGNDTLDLQLSNPCLVVPPNVCYHTTFYRDTVNLPFRPGGYQLAYQRCCRNQTLLNIIDPLQTGATYYSFISEEALLGCNNGAFFNDWPPFFICANFPVSFDHHAVDVDGDSIVYEMCAPFEGATFAIPRPQPPNAPPYDSVVWVNPPYNTDNMLGGVPLDIDPVTGFLDGIPNTTGQFVVGICAKEYRNGVLISTTKRDFQFNVGICGLQVVSSFFAPEIDCENELTISFNNQSNGSDEYFWDFGDGEFSNDENPTHTFPDSGHYVVTLIAGPGAACTDTFSREINVQYESLFVDFDLEYSDCEDSITIDFIDLSFDTLSNIVMWEWDFGNGQESNEQFPEISYDQPGTYTVSLRVTAENGCQFTDQEVVQFGQPEIELLDRLAVCENGPPVALNPDGNPDFLYEWIPSEGLNDPLSYNPLALPDSSTTYTVFVSVFNNFDTCSVMENVSVELLPPVSVTAPPDTNICTTQILLEAVSSNGTGVYQWSEAPDFSNILNPNGEASLDVSVENSETFYVRVESSDGCEAIDSVTITRQMIEIDTDPLIQVCLNDTVQLDVMNLDPSDILTFEWTPLDDIISGENTANPVVVPTASTQYTVTATNQFGCSSIAMVDIDVSSLTPFLEVWSDRDSIYPGETVQLFSTENTNYEYSWEPIETLSDPTIPDPIAKPMVTTTYLLTITDEFGCKNLDSVTIFLKNFICDEPYIFVPNAFTPNSDGVNDKLYVRANAITELYFAVYNRWGELVFETRSLNEGWDGTFRGEQLSPDVFAYYLKLRCLNEEEYFKKGNVTLIR